MNFLKNLFNQPRLILILIGVACFSMLGFGFYLQHSIGLEPCPMCIVQRYAMLLVGLFAFLGAIFPKGKARIFSYLLMILSAGFGAFVAARQSFLQWNPPEVVTCGRDFYGMIENFPLRNAIPMIFKGSGDCSAIDWTFLGGSIANWAFVAFVAFFIVGLILIFKQCCQK